MSDSALRDLVAAIRAAREDAGLTQQQMADQLGVSRSSVANMEGGRQEIGVTQLAAVARALHMDPAMLLGLVSLPPRPHVVTVEAVLRVSCTTCGGVVLEVTPSRDAAEKVRDKHIAGRLREEAEDAQEAPGGYRPDQLLAARHDTPDQTGALTDFEPLDGEPDG